MMLLGIIALVIVAILMGAPGVPTLYLDDDTEGYHIKQTLCFCEKTALEDDIEGHPVYCNRYFRCKPDPETIYFHKHEYQCAADYSFNPASALDKTQPPCMLGPCNGPVAPTTESPETGEPIFLKETYTNCYGEYKYYMKMDLDNCLMFFKCVRRPAGNLGRDVYECPHGWGFDEDAMWDENVPPCKKGLCMPGEFNCSWVSSGYTKWQNPHNCHEYYDCSNREEAVLKKCRPETNFFHHWWASCRAVSECPQIPS